MGRRHHLKSVHSYLLFAVPRHSGHHLFPYSTLTHSTQGDRISPDVLLASAKAMSSFAIPCAVSGTVIDIVGTGGDSVDTFNASTAAALYDLQQ